MHPVLNTLKERKLTQWALAYLAGAWVLLQVLDVLGDKFGSSAGAFRLVAVVLGMGLLATLVLAWYHGEKGRQGVSGIELLMLAGILLIGGGVMALVHRGPAAEAPQSGGESAPTPAAPERSIAVLPFADLSEKHDQEYFSDGLTEELLNTLARVDGLRVAARTSSFAFKGQGADVREVGRKLGVATVLEGSVRRSGNRLKISVQLISVADGYQLWSGTYDRELKDVFAVQEEISRAVVRSLLPKLCHRGGCGDADG